MKSRVIIERRRLQCSLGVKLLPVLCYLEGDMNSDCPSEFCSSRPVLDVLAGVEYCPRPRLFDAECFHDRLNSTGSINVFLAVIPIEKDNRVNVLFEVKPDCVRR